MATAPTTALGMDTFVPNDTVRQMPIWAALTGWVTDAPPETGGIPLGIKGKPIKDWLPVAFALGRNRAGITRRGDTSRVLIGDCFVTAEGGTTKILARRNAPLVEELVKTLMMSSGHMLVLTGKGELKFSREGGELKLVDLTSLGYVPNAQGVLPPYPVIEVFMLCAAGYDEAYLFGNISLSTGPSHMYLYRVKSGVATKVAFLPPAIGTSVADLAGYTHYDYDLWTGYAGALMFRVRPPSGVTEHYIAYGDSAALAGFSSNSVQSGYRIYRPVVISPNMTLGLRFGNDRHIPGSTAPLSSRLRCILTSTQCYTTPEGVEVITTNDIASTSTHGDIYATPPSVKEIGNGMAVVTMPRLSQVGQVDNVTINAGFQSGNPYSYWAVEYPVDGFGIFAKSQEVMVTDGVDVALLAVGVDYNREVTVIPLGGGKALLFYSRVTGYAQGLSLGSESEINYFDGSIAQKLSVTDVYPDVEGMCLGDGAASFITCNTYADTRHTWYGFRNGVLTKLGTDPNQGEGLWANPMLVNCYVGDGVGIIPRRYLDSANRVASSHLWVFGLTELLHGAVSYKPPKALAFVVKGKWQTVKSITQLAGAAILVSYFYAPDSAPTEFHYSYFSVIDGGADLVPIGSVNNPTPGGYQPLEVVRVSESSAVLQLTVSGVSKTYRVSKGSTAAALTLGGARFSLAELALPKDWTGDLGPVGENFVMFKPSTVRDLRPAVLASSGS